jgi:hypothetical protein
VSAVLLSIVALAADGASDSGGANAGESASAWDVGGVLFWTLIVLAALAVLVAGLVLNARRGRPGPPATVGSDPTGDGGPVARRERDVHPQAGWDLAVLTFDHLEGAERAYADVCAKVGQPGWRQDLAFVEMHRHGRIIAHGTFAGRYLDERDLAKAEGESPIVAEVRADVPEGSSGLVAFAPPEEVELLLGDFGERPATFTRRRVSSAEAAGLTRAVAGAPIATAPEDV